MELKKFIGVWKNEAGNKLIIEPKNKKSLSVTFISHLTHQPIKRQYSDGSESIHMTAELDYYGTTLEVHLWDKGKGFYLCLMNDPVDENELVPGISRNVEDKFLEKYYSLFYPLERFKKIDK